MYNDIFHLQKLPNRMKTVAPGDNVAFTVQTEKSIKTKLFAPKRRLELDSEIRLQTGYRKIKKDSAYWKAKNNL